MPEEIRVFIGSASEDLPIVEVVRASLKRVKNATIVPKSWTEDDIRTPSGMFLDDLIREASENDLGIFVLGPSDMVDSRGILQPAPRDNVIFELGLFMSQLGRERIVVLAPTWRTKLKIFSDLVGFNAISYPLPKGKKVATIPKDELKMILSDACRKIKNRVLRAGVRTVVWGRGPKSVNAVGGKMEEFIRGLDLSSSRKVQNLALDMEHTWDLLYGEILANPSAHDVHVQVLMIDHRSEAIRMVASASVSQKIAARSEKQIVGDCRHNAAALSKRNIIFECRAYSEVPTFHGFLFNDMLLFSFCNIEDGRLWAKRTPYLQLEEPSARSRDEAANYFIGTFRNWFEHRWTTARSIWPEIRT